jgi:hypothetical protein
VPPGAGGSVRRPAAHRPAQPSRRIGGWSWSFPPATIEPAFAVGFGSHVDGARKLLRDTSAALPDRLAAGAGRDTGSERHFGAPQTGQTLAVAALVCRA